MSESSVTIRLSDFLSDTEHILARLRYSQEPVIVNENGETAAVILSPAAYERAQHERELLLMLARGEKEIASGEGYELDDVLNDADLILQGSQP